MPVTSAKFHREKDQRKALMRSLAASLVKHGSIETTVIRAKSLRPFAEKIITKAKGGSLHDRRQVISELNSVELGNKLVDNIAPKLANRQGGYLKIERNQSNRRGDNAELARISFVDDLKAEVKEKIVASKPVETAKTAVKKPAAPKKPAVSKKESK